MWHLVLLPTLVSSSILAIFKFHDVDRIGLALQEGFPDQSAREQGTKLHLRLLKRRKTYSFLECQICPTDLGNATLDLFSQAMMPSVQCVKP